MSIQKNLQNYKKMRIIKIQKFTNKKINGKLKEDGKILLTNDRGGIMI